MVYNKYKVSPKDDRTWREDIYDSKAEMLYAQHLDSSPDVLIWSRGTKVALDCIGYKPDFRVDYKDGVTLWIDVKGKQTAAFRIKLKLWQKHGPGTLRLVKYNGKRKFGHAWKVLGDYGPGLPKVVTVLRKKKVRP